MKAIDIALPVYNEAAGIALFHARLTEVLATLADRYRFQIIYVVDRSTDGTYDALKAIAAAHGSVRVVHLSSRFGHQMSLVAGLDQSSGDALIMMDADLQHPPEVIPRLLDAFEQGADVVSTVRQYGRDAGSLKRWSSSLFYRVQNAMSPVTIADGMSDFRLVSRRVVEVFQRQIREQHQFLRGLFQWVGFRRAEVPFVAGERAAGTTKYRPARLLAFSVNGLVSFSKVPLRLAAIAGAAFVLAGAAGSIWVVARDAVWRERPSGALAILLTLLVIGGLQLLCLGVLGEYVANVFDEVKRRPLYLIDEIIDRP